jgi:sugar phosphate permease
MLFIFFKGICETTGRILCGFIADLSFINPLHLNNVMLMFSGIAVFMVPFCTTFPTLLAFSALYGLFVGKTFHCLI